MAQNTVKPEKTGFGMAITARLRPVFCVFRPKIPRTFYFKLTEQSSRKKLAEGGFEPEKRSLIIITNRELSGWISAAEDTHLMQTLVDRITANSQIIRL